MRVLVTGASGFVGHAIVQILTERGVEAVAVSRRSPARSAATNWKPLDLMDRLAVRRFVEDYRPTHIIHSAWTVEHGKFWTAPDNLDWVSATLSLAQIAQANGCERFVGLGSCFEYKWPDDGVCDEATTPVENHTLYDTAKDATRRILSSFLRGSGCSLAWARLFHLYGPAEALGRLVPSIARSVAAGTPANCSSGSQIRDFIEVSDAARAIVTLATSNVSGAVNIGSGEPKSIAEIANMIGRISGRPDLIRLGALPDRGGDPPYVVAGMSRLRDEDGQGPGGAKIHKVYFNADTAGRLTRTPNIVASRHTIEHIPDPVSFLQTVRSALTSSTAIPVLLETPRVEWIFENGAIHDLFYEHCSLFSERAVHIALSRAGFDDINIKPLFGGQYQWATARLSARQDNKPTGTAELSWMKGLDSKYRDYVTHWKQEMHRAKEAGPVVIWGAGAKGASFAMMINTERQLIDAAVDINPGKQGRFMPGSGLEILSPEAAAKRGVSTVLVMNPNYYDEVVTAVTGLGLTANVKSL